MAKQEESILVYINKGLVVEFTTTRLLFNYFRVPFWAVGIMSRWEKWGDKAKCHG